MRRFLLSMILALTTISIWANYVELEDIEYKLNDENKTATVTGNHCAGDVIIPEYITVDDVQYSVTSISEFAFWDNEALTSIVIPNSVTSIGERVFDGCTSLASIQLPNQITSINDFTFYGCKALTSIEIPNSVTRIGKYAFNSCEALSSLPLPNSVTSIGDFAFSGCKAITVMRIPNSVTSVGTEAFNWCKSLTAIEIPNSVTSMGENVFRLCDNLDKIYISCKDDDDFSNYIQRTDLHIFHNDVLAGKRHSILIAGEEQKQLVIPNSVTRIESEAFCNCTGITSVTIPNSVISIGDLAFSGCTALTSVTSLALEAPTISENTFSTHGTLHVPLDYEAPYKDADYWSSYFTIVDDFVDPEIRRVKFGTYDFVTYCSDANLDFSWTEEVKAYIASSYDPITGSLTITRVYNVPAGEGMLLKGTPGKTYEIHTTENASVVANLLKGTIQAIILDPTDDDKTNFILSQDDEGVIGFYRFYNSFPMPARQAWLQIPTRAFSDRPASTKGFRFVEEGDVLTGMSDIEWKSAGNNLIYDLQGRCSISLPSRGLYIQDGKKIVRQ